jgi:hypothetical protein
LDEPLVAPFAGTVWEYDVPTTVTCTEDDVSFANSTQPPTGTDTEFMLNRTSDCGAAAILITAHGTAAAGCSMTSAPTTTAGTTSPAVSAATAATRLTRVFSPTRPPVLQPAHLYLQPAHGFT